MNKQSLNVLALGLSLGILWALGVLSLGIVASMCGYGHQLVALLGDIYLGYQPTLVGSLIGAIWAFIDFFIFGVFIALLYNYLVKRLGKNH